jgi:Zn-dependent protease
LPVLFLLKRFSKPGSPWRDMVEAALNTNVFLLVVGLLPIPGIDGGAVLKWSLVERGQTTSQADANVCKINGVLSAGLAAGSTVAFKKKRRWLGGFLGLLAALTLVISTGMLKEQR